MNEKYYSKEIDYIIDRTIIAVLLFIVIVLIKVGFNNIERNSLYIIVTLISIISGFFYSLNAHKIKNAKGIMYLIYNIISGVYLGIIIKCVIIILN